MKNRYIGLALSLSLIFPLIITSIKSKQGVKQVDVITGTGEVKEARATINQLFIDSRKVTKVNHDNLNSYSRIFALIKLDNTHYFFYNLRDIPIKSSLRNGIQNQQRSIQIDDCMNILIKDERNLRSDHTRAFTHIGLSSCI